MASRARLIFQYLKCATVIAVLDRAGVVYLAIAVLGLSFNQRSRFRRSVIDLDPQHRIVRQQFFRSFLCSGLTLALCLEMPIHNKCKTACWRNISALNISWLLLLDLKRRLFHGSDLCAIS
jgi:hypothetical protein